MVCSVLAASHFRLGIRKTGQHYASVQDRTIAKLATDVSRPVLFEPSEAPSGLKFVGHPQRWRENHIPVRGKVSDLWPFLAYSFPRIGASWPVWLW